MNKIIEPLKPEPTHVENSDFHSLTHGYNLGFHDGACALAVALLDSQRAGGSIWEALESYERKEARPCKGWNFEPNKPEPKPGKPFNLSDGHAEYFGSHIRCGKK